jgi:hypothetical protein
MYIEWNFYPIMVKNKEFMPINKRLTRHETRKEEK